MSKQFESIIINLEVPFYELIKISCSELLRNCRYKHFRLILSMNKTSSWKARPKLLNNHMKSSITSLIQVVTSCFPHRLTMSWKIWKMRNGCLPPGNFYMDHYMLIQIEELNLQKNVAWLRMYLRIWRSWGPPSKSNITCGYLSTSTYGVTWDETEYFSSLLKSPI